MDENWLNNCKTELLSIHLSIDNYFILTYAPQHQGKFCMCKPTWKSTWF